MFPGHLIRRARPQDVVAIARLNSTYADEDQMLRRSPETISLAIDDLCRGAGRIGHPARMRCARGILAERGRGRRHRGGEDSARIRAGTRDRS